MILPIAKVVENIFSEHHTWAISRGARVNLISYKSGQSKLLNTYYKIKILKVITFVEKLFKYTWI